MLVRESYIQLADKEMDLLLEDIYKHYGYDFSDYSKASLRRRVSRLIMDDHLPSVAELRFRLINDETYFNHFLEEVTVNVTEMFRDPLFFKALRDIVLPQLKTYPRIRIWHAGCATGEEVYSMAILLKEEGLLDRSLLYATDINQHVLEKAKAGTFPIDDMKQCTINYQKAGGTHTFSDYYTAKYGKVIFNTDLKKRMVFSTHNLQADQSFNEFNLILCRNVMIYFNRGLQEKVIGLFHESLPALGYLALGSKETVNFTNLKTHFETVDAKQKIWRKKT